MGTGQRYSDAAAMIERLGDLITNMEARIETRAQEMAQPRIAAAEDAAALRVTWAESEVTRSQALIVELRRQVDAGLRMRDQAQRERDQARADASAVGISSIDRMLGDVIDHALEGGAKLVVEYCGPGSDDFDDFGCFVAAIIKDDELVRDAIGDTAMEAVRSLRPIAEPGPVPDEQPF